MESPGIKNTGLARQIMITLPRS